MVMQQMDSQLKYQARTRLDIEKKRNEKQVSSKIGKKVFNTHHFLKMFFFQIALNNSRNQQLRHGITNASYTQNSKIIITNGIPEINHIYIYIWLIYQDHMVFNPASTRPGWPEEEMAPFNELLPGWSENLGKTCLKTLKNGLKLPNFPHVSWQMDANGGEKNPPIF